jgi:molybdenum cofactor cytidylyltransferase
VASTALQPVVVVLGGSSGEIQAGVDVGTALPIVNPDYLTGQASSLRAGLRTVRADAAAVVFVLGDQPLQSSTVITGVIEAYRAGAGPIVVPRYRDGRGNPVLFDRSLFDQLEALEGDQGARPLLRDQPHLVHEVAFPDRLMPLDIDTWEDYRAVLRAAGEADPGPSEAP